MISLQFSGKLSATSEVIIFLKFEFSWNERKIAEIYLLQHNYQTESSISLLCCGLRINLGIVLSVLRSRGFCATEYNSPVASGRARSCFILRNKNKPGGPEARSAREKSPIVKTLAVFLVLCLPKRDSLTFISDNCVHYLLTTSIEPRYFHNFWPSLLWKRILRSERLMSLIKRWKNDDMHAYFTSEIDKF